MAKTPDPAKDEEFNETLKRALTMAPSHHKTKAEAAKQEISPALVAKVRFNKSGKPMLEDVEWLAPRSRFGLR